MDRDLKEQLHLRKERTSGRIFRKTTELEIAKQTVGTSTRLWKMSVRTLWRGQPLQNKRRGAHRVKARDDETPATLGSLSTLTERRISIICILLWVMTWKRRLVVVHLDQLAPYEGTAWDKWP
jgi:hypothetical protein